MASPSETRVLHVAARSAEDEGDFIGALRLVRRLPDADWSRSWQQELMAASMLDSGDLAGLACWLIYPAMRWAREQSGGLVLDLYADLMLRMLGVKVEERTQRLAETAGGDPVVVDAGLFDSGLFDAYLARLDQAALGSRLVGVTSWSSQPALVYQVHAVHDQGVELRDLCTERVERARRWPEASAGTLTYGRSVWVAGDIGRAFALAPVTVDQRCAARIVRARRQASGPEERLRAVGHSRRRAIEAGEQGL